MFLDKCGFHITKLLGFKFIFLHSTHEWLDTLVNYVPRHMNKLLARQMSKLLLNTWVKSLAWHTNGSTHKWLNTKLFGLTIEQTLCLTYKLTLWFNLEGNSECWLKGNSFKRLVQCNPKTLLLARQPGTWGTANSFALHTRNSSNSFAWSTRNSWTWPIPTAAFNRRTCGTGYLNNTKGLT